MKKHAIARKKPLRSSPGIFHSLLTSVLLYCASNAQSAPAVDYIELQNEMDRNLAHVDELEVTLGRYNYQLMEPLEQLARIQMRANRFDDAEAAIEQAIQIARFSDGLYSSTQYPLLKLEIEISRARRDWDETLEQLDHLTWLTARKFEGDSETQLQTLNWLANTHLQCALDTDTNHRAAHLIKATMLSETAVQMAQLTRHTDEPIYPQLLHALSGKNYAEARSVFGDSKVSYAVRRLFPGMDIMVSKGEARDVRYRAGLEKLLMLRDVVAGQTNASAEAIAMAEIYVADWKLAFNRSTDIAGEYATAIALLQEAGITPERIERFFANPVVLPRTDFTLSFEEALTTIETATSYVLTSVAGADGNAVASSTTYQLSLLESNHELPGLVEERAGKEQLPEATGEWTTLALSLDVDPAVQSRTNNGGYTTASYVTPSDIAIQDETELDSGELKATLARIKAIPFRPAMRQGTPVAATFAVNFSFRESESAGLSRLLSLR